MLFGYPDVHGAIGEVHNDETLEVLPEGAVSLTTEQAAQRWDWRLINGALSYAPCPSAAHEWNGSAWVLSLELQQKLRASMAADLCHQVDQVADAARRAVTGDPLRAVEYERAASEAQAFASAGYQGEVPPMVAAWAINGRTAQQATDSILSEAAQYNGALVQLRAVRLQAKEQIRALMSGNQVEQAQQLATQTIAAIEAAVAGIGNNSAG